MDDRKLDIKQGQGLEESRVNQDFVDFLKKWSVPVLWLIVIVSGGMMAWQWYQRREKARVNDAFAALATNVEGVAEPSPGSLQVVATDHEGVGSVALLSRLRLADLYLTGVRRGLVTGSELGPDGRPVNAEDALDEEGRAEYLDKAESNFRAVLDATKGDADKAVLAVNAAFGLAAVAESRGDFDGAAARYQDASSLAEKAGLKELGGAAASRIQSLDSLKNLPAILPQAQLPLLPGEQPVAAVTPANAAPEAAPPESPDAGNPAPANPAEGG